MNLALAILFLWIGCALLTIAFHPLHTEDLTMDASGKHPLGPTTAIKSFKGPVGAVASAYDFP